MRGLRAWSLIAGSLSIAVSGVATMWLPYPWNAAAWAGSALALCTVCGLLAPWMLQVDSQPNKQTAGREAATKDSDHE